MAFDKFTELQKEMENLITKTEENLTPILADLSKETGQDYDISKYISDFRKSVDSNKKVVLSVIGQVKTGKSTLLNSLIFDGVTILPEAPTPKSARLARILPAIDQPTSVKVFYYTAAEFEEIKTSDDLDVREIYERATMRLSKEEIKERLGTEADVGMLDLEDYVTAEGMYADLVKYVYIYVALDTRYMELEVVDTPGMNDPVQSRERQTMDFLRETDAVLFLSRPSHFLDTKDLDLTLRYMPSLGLSEGIVVAPQFDLLYPNQRSEYFTSLKPGMVARAKTYAKRENFGEHTVSLIERFFAPENTVEVSALSHQLGRKIKRGEPLTTKDQERLEGLKKRSWDTSSTDSLVDNSGLRELEELIDRRIVKRRAEIKLRRPFERLQGEFNEIKTRNRRKVTELQEDIALTEKTVEEHKQKREEQLQELKGYSEAVRTVLRRINAWESKDFSYPELGGVNLIPNREVLEAEVSQKAQSSFRAAVRRVKEQVLSSVEQTRNDIEGLSRQYNRNVGIQDEVEDLALSMAREMRSRLDSEEFSVAVNFSWNIFKTIGSIFGGSTKAEQAQKALSQATLEINKKLEQAFKSTLGFFADHVETIKHRIQLKLDNEISALKNSVEELQGIIDSKEKDLPAKKKKWQAIEVLSSRLDAELTVLEPLYQEIAKKLSPSDGGETE